MYFLVKLLTSALIIAAVSEVAKRSTAFGALIASLPLTSLLAILWLYHDTGSAEKVASLSSEILWLVIPSLILFAALPLLIRRGFTVYPALGISAACTVGAYLLTYFVMHRFVTRG
jgi:hypothetical protein